MSKPLWLEDLDAWERLSIPEQLDHLRVHYCTGPCGQSHSSLMVRKVTGDTLKTAAEHLRGLYKEWEYGW